MKAATTEHLAWTRGRYSLAAGLLLLIVGALPAQRLPRKIDGQATYFEFGTVVSVGRDSIDVREMTIGKVAGGVHRFLFSKDSRSDVVRSGDPVEVVFTVDAVNGSSWTIQRLLMFSAGLPQPLTPSNDVAEVPPPGRSMTPPTVPVRAARSVPPPGRVRPDTRAATLPTSMPPRSTPPVAVDLSRAPVMKVPPVIAVPLGGVEAATAHPLSTRTVARDTPSEACNRSNSDWPLQPITMAILDFRYPTDREESHDVGTTGGGSGTAVADLVYDRLVPQQSISYRRGDRDKLYRGDFAGAARVGRQLGVDAVLAGTFFPVDSPPDANGYPGPKTYELRAGMVDTCTGQLLMRLSSAICPGGIDTGGTANGCRRIEVTAKQANDPKDAAGSFKPALDALLLPLEHGGTPPGQRGSAGVVTAVARDRITVRLESSAHIKVGDQMALHAWRLAKNPTTYTLHTLHDEEIGRVTVTGVQSGVASGIYTGDFAPSAGDTAEVVSAE